MIKNFLLILTLAWGVMGANYYVDTITTGLNNGTSWQNAWQGLKSIAWTDITGGDTIFISGGADTTKYTDTLKIQKAGLIDNPFVITIGRSAGHNGYVVIPTVYAWYLRKHWVLDGFNGSDAVRRIIIDGNSDLDETVEEGEKTDGISLYASDSITIKNVVVQNFNDNGIKIRYNIYFINIINCRIKNTRYDGININVEDTLSLPPANRCEIYVVDSCVIDSCMDDAITICACGVTLKNSYLRCGDLPAFQGSHPDAVQILEGKRWICIDNNKIINAQQGVFCERTNGFVRITNNLFYDTPDESGYNAQISINESDKNGGNIGHTLIANNVFYHAVWAAIRFPPSGFDPEDSLIIKNNIFYDCAHFFMDTCYRPYKISKSNIFWNTSTAFCQPSCSAYPDSGMHIDPLFVNPTAYDFTLQPTSPAIGSGDDLSAYFTTDRAGLIRSVPWDIGPYEYGTPPQPTNPTITSVSPSSPRLFKTFEATGTNLLNCKLYLNSVSLGTPASATSTSISDTALGTTRGFHWLIAEDTLTGMRCSTSSRIYIKNTQLDTVLLRRP